MCKYFLSLLLLSSAFLTAQTPQVLAFAGSARADSVNKKLVQEAARMASEMKANVIYIDLKDYPLPLFDEDLEASQGMPENAKALRKLMINSQVIFISSPEHNHSVTALLKNVLDWTSRDEKEGKVSREPYKDKTFAIMAASPGRSGGKRGLPHLRAIITDIGGHVLEKEFTLPGAYTAFDEKGHLKDPSQQAELSQLVTASLNSQG